MRFVQAYGLQSRALRRVSTISSQISNTRFDSLFSRRYRQPLNSAPEIGVAGEEGQSVRHAQIASGMPARPIERENGVSADEPTDFGQMQWHGFGIGAEHHKSGGFDILGAPRM